MAYKRGRILVYLNIQALRKVADGIHVCPYHAQVYTLNTAVKVQRIYMYADRRGIIENTPKNCNIVILQQQIQETFLYIKIVIKSLARNTEYTNFIGMRISTSSRACYSDWIRPYRISPPVTRRVEVHEDSTKLTCRKGQTQH